MQASKIEIGRIYAINRYDEDDKLVGLARFQVSAVVTKRVNAYGNPHDYESWVEGYYFDDERREGPVSTVTISPKAVLGPYEEQAELKALADAKKAADEAEDRRRKEIVLELRKLMYDAIGVAVPNDDREYRQPIRVSGYDLDINWAAVEPLLEYFRNRRGA